MKKVLHFMNRRIVPVLMALVIAFFSVVIPCSRVEASTIVAPVGGFSYFDLTFSLLQTTGFEASIFKEDGTQKSFTEEMYDELCDTFDIWCYNNFETTDADEIKDQLRALPGAIANGTVTVTKALWEALKGYASDAYAYLSTHFQGDKTQYVVDGKYTWAYVQAVCGCIPTYYSLSDVFESTTYPFIIGKTSSGEFFYSDAYISSESYFYINYFGIRSTTSDRSQDHSRYAYVWTPGDSGRTVYAGQANGLFLDAFILDVNAGAFVPDISVSNWKDVADANKDVVWPKQDLAVDKVSTSTWEDALASDLVIPGEAADTAVITLTDTGEDSVTIPGTITDDPAIDHPAVDDPSTDATENVDPGLFQTLFDKVADVGDITTLFPFCIPFDIVTLVKGMQAEKKPPVWHFEYYFEDLDYTFEFTVDMTDYEQYIKIFRAGIVIFWVITLMFVTIRYSSGIAKD